MRKLNTIIAGATGLIGESLCDFLLVDEEVESVTVLTRKELNKPSEKFKELIVDFDKLSIARLEQKIDVAFCCLGTTMKTAGSKDAFYRVDFTYCLEFAKLAKQNGAKTFVLVSSLGANANTSNFYLKVKGEIQQAIDKLGFEAFIIMQPSMLLGDRKENRLGESIGKVLITGLDFLITGPFKKYKAIHARTVAQAMLKSAKGDFEGMVIFESDKIQAYV